MRMDRAQRATQPDRPVAEGPWQRAAALLTAFVADDGHRIIPMPNLRMSRPALLDRASHQLQQFGDNGGLLLLSTIVIVIALGAMSIEVGFWLYASELGSAGSMHLPEQIMLVALGCTAATLLALQMRHRHTLEQRDSDAVRFSQQVGLEDTLAAYRREIAHQCQRIAELEARHHAPATRDERLALIGHDLRTPLNAVIGFADLMAQEVYGPIGHPKYREYARHVRDSGKTLLGVAQDILAIEAQQRETVAPAPSAVSAKQTRGSDAAFRRPPGELTAIDLDVAAAKLDVEGAITRSLAGLRQTAADLTAANGRPAVRFGRRVAA